MKKSITLLLLMVLALSAMAGCGGTGGASPTAAPTAAPTTAPTAAPAPEPTAAPTAEPTAAPTAAPTAEPTAVPTPEPTPEPTSEPTPEPTPAPTPEPTAAPTETPAPTPEPGPDLEGLTPVYGDALRDGSYAVTVDSGGSKFRVNDCTLTVSGGRMEALIIVSGVSFSRLRLEEAASGGEDGIDYVKNADGQYTFTLPVSALDAPIACSAYNKKDEQWIDCTLVFRADSLPAGAFTGAGAAPEEDQGLADGTYTVEIVFAGGSGRASVVSPALLTVSGGVCTARIEWSSPNYDYMKVDGEQYFPVNTEGNSVFLIPVAAFDQPITVIGDTTAMSTPHEIEYTLTFISDSIQVAE